MTQADTVISSAVRPTAGRLPLLTIIVMVLGACAYAVFAAGPLLPAHLNYIGYSLYDQYYLALLDGHLDVPARVLKYEGHYAPDGTGYVYQGVAPLLTRLAFGWAFPLGSVSMGPFSIWLWSVIGSLGYHLATMSIARRAWPEGARGFNALAVLVALAAWFGSPGLLLTGSTAFYNEPIAVTYATTGLFTLLWISVVQGRLRLRHALPGLAILAALALHGRPNIAVGLYLGTACAAAFALRAGWRQAFVSAAIAFAILGASGLGYLALNVAKFGSPTQAHGTFGAGQIQYGFVFWGAEDAHSERATAFREHGKFNARRIPHNLTLYALDIPENGPTLTKAGTSFRNWVTSTLGAGLGYIKIEPPNVGILFLWPVWILLAICSLRAGRKAWTNMLPLLIGTGVAAALTLAYGTVALRYRVDLWPAIAALALLGLGWVIPKVATRTRTSILRIALIVSVATGGLMTLATARMLQAALVEPATEKTWSLEHCRELSRAKGLPDTRIAEVCRSPRGSE